MKRTMGTEHTPPSSRSMRKKRLDQLLVDRGLAESRTRAQALIMSGLVIVGDKRMDKPGTFVSLEIPISLKGQTHPWASRGGLKLEKGIKIFGICPTNKIALDIGASTGGFTDVLLSHSAQKVYAVDVGYGQLAHRLRIDPRVIVLERTNARHLTAHHIPEWVDLIVCDASFIGLRTVLEKPLSFLRPGGFLIALIKPQFEVGKAKLGKKGVVRDPDLHLDVCHTIKTWLLERPGWSVLGIEESPIQGPEGNTEFLIAAHFQASESPE